MTALSENISQVLELNPEEILKIETAFRPLDLAKGELWIKEGKVLVCGRPRTLV